MRSLRERVVDVQFLLLHAPLERLPLRGGSPVRLLRHAAVDPNDMANHAAGGSWLPPLSETLKEIAGDETGYAPSFLDSPMQESVARDLGEALEYRPCA